MVLLPGGVEPVTRVATGIYSASGRMTASAPESPAMDVYEPVKAFADPRVPEYLVALRTVLIAHVPVLWSGVAAAPPGGRTLGHGIANDHLPCHRAGAFATSGSP